MKASEASKIRPEITVDRFLDHIQSYDLVFACSKQGSRFNGIGQVHKVWKDRSKVEIDFSNCSFSNDIIFSTQDLKGLTVLRSAQGKVFRVTRREAEILTANIKNLEKLPDFLVQENNQFLSGNLKGL